MITTFFVVSLIIYCHFRFSDIECQIENNHDELMKAIKEKEGKV